SHKYKDFAVLYRTNAQSRAIEETFVRYGLADRCVGVSRFYDHKEIKNIMAYLRLIYQPEDRVSFARVVNVPTRGIGAKSLENFYSCMETTTRSPVIPASEPGSSKKEEDFFDWIPGQARDDSDGERLELAEALLHVEQCSVATRKAK